MTTEPALVRSCGSKHDSIIISNNHNGVTHSRIYQAQAMTSIAFQVVIFLLERFFSTILTTLLNVQLQCSIYDGKEGKLLGRQKVKTSISKTFSIRISTEQLPITFF